MVGDFEHELLDSTSVLAHAVHLPWPELSRVLSTGAWIIHNPTSNQNNQVGYAPAGKFGARATLGTDGIGADMFEEARRAHFRAREAGAPIDVLKWLTNGHRLASQVFGGPIGPLREGAVSDLLVLDYHPPTPVTDANLAGHFLFGLASRHVESVMIEGMWRMWARRPLSVAPEALTQRAQEAAKGLWARMAELP